MYNLQKPQDIQSVVYCYYISVHDDCFQISNIIIVDSIVYVQSEFYQLMKINSSGFFVWYIYCIADII